MCMMILLKSVPRSVFFLHYAATSTLSVWLLELFAYSLVSPGCVLLRPHNTKPCVSCLFSESIIYVHISPFWLFDLYQI
jgi:hypothetical protein